MSQRFTPQHLETWRQDGGVLIEDFFTTDEVAAVVRDFDAVFGRTEGDQEALDRKQGDEIGRFHPAQFKGVAPVPLDCSPALNLIGVHPALIQFAKAALETDDVHVYQCQAWAKFTGEADYDQPLHTDFANHSLVAPAEDAALNSVTILCYFTDVTDAHGPMRYVRRPDSERIAGPEASLGRDPEAHARLQQALRPFERSSASRAGSVFPYTIDVYHRGSNLTAPGGRRYALMTCFKRAGNDSIGFHAWAFHHTKPWARIFDHATPEQLACFGVPRPGHPYWTPLTLERAQTRYPGWDLTPYREAIAVPA
jgi:Phytanoyl-CoA dioxygenase (PhyH)